MIFDDFFSAMIIMPECESAVQKLNSIWASSYVVIGLYKFWQFVAKISSFCRQEVMGGILDSVKNVWYVNILILFNDFW